MSQLKLKIKTSVDNFKLKLKTFGKLKRKSTVNLDATAAAAAAAPIESDLAGPVVASVVEVAAAAAEPTPVVAQTVAQPTEVVSSAAPAPTNAAYNLYSRGFCPFTQQVRIALAFKGVETTFTRLAPNDPLPVWWNDASPDNSVPVLQFPDGSFSNSSVGIIERLEAEIPTPSLLPGDASIVKQWAGTIRQELFPAFNKVLMGTHPDVQAEFRPKLKAIIEKITDQLESRMSDQGPYFVGAEFSLADLVLAPILARLELIAFYRGVEFSNPTLLAYIQTLDSHSAVSSVAYPYDDMKKFFNNAIPKQKPISIGKLQHTVIRAQFEKSILAATNLSHGLVEDAAVTAKELQARFKTLATLVRKHSHFEDKIVYPVFEQLKSGQTVRAQKEHQDLDSAIDSFEPVLIAALERIVKGESKFGRCDEFKSILNKLRDLSIESKIHMHQEEADMFALSQALTAEQEEELVFNIYKEFKPINEVILPFILEGLAPYDGAQYLYNLEKTVGGSNWADIRILLSKKLSLPQWRDLTYRVPGLAL
ncbi:UNVERIFIED_CONTAM: hypothetical protein HDU68_012096 [Siphonaria sp. JEL0065]|nr:hypothetical protein HDU68_012096 [Siphonaria sp. JEL0065]